MNQGTSPRKHPATEGDSNLIEDNTTRISKNRQSEGYCTQKEINMRIQILQMAHVIRASSIVLCVNIQYAVPGFLNIRLTIRTKTHQQSARYKHPMHKCKRSRDLSLINTFAASKYE